VRAALSRTDITVNAERQPTRLYGHDLGDLIALGFITGLAEIDETPSDAKIQHVRDLIEQKPKHIDLGLERAGPRKGMWSVSEPQVVVAIKRTGD